MDGSLWLEHCNFSEIPMEFLSNDIMILFGYKIKIADKKNINLNFNREHNPI